MSRQRPASGEGRPLRAGRPAVLQVSRWDRLKDPLGVIQGFVDHVAPDTDAHLVYAGPAVEAVSDDPEGEEVLAEARALFDRPRPRDARSASTSPRCRWTTSRRTPPSSTPCSATPPSSCRRAWPRASGSPWPRACGRPGRWWQRASAGSRTRSSTASSGVLLDDPTDLAEYGARSRELLNDPDRAGEIGPQRHGAGARRLPRRAHPAAVLRADPPAAPGLAT